VKPKKDCPTCGGLGEFTNPFDQTYRCKCTKRKRGHRAARSRDKWEAEAMRLCSGLEEIATHEQRVGATVIYSGEWCVAKAREVLKI